MQELQVACGFHVVLNARSLTKSMLDHDKGCPLFRITAPGDLKSRVSR
jgi:hypothetical protein